MNNQFRKKLESAKTPIAWLDSLASVEMVKQAVSIRPQTPALIFPMFWQREKIKEIFDLVDNIGIQAFYCAPIKAEVNQDFIITDYETDVFRATRHDPYAPEFLEKLLIFEAQPKLVPSFLWDTLFVAEEMTDIKMKANKTSLVRIYATDH